MKKTIKTGILIVVVMVLAFLYAHIDKNTYLYNRHTETNRYVGTGILIDQEISQSFTCTEDVIDGMNVKCSITGNVEKVILNYSLKNDKTGDIEASGEIKATELKNNKFHQLKFEQFSGVSGNQYTFTIKEIGSDSANGVSFFITPEEKNGKLMISGNDTNGTFIVRVISHRFDMETFVVLLAFVAYIVLFFKFLYKLFK